jgi:hypothetical protein
MADPPKEKDNETRYTPDNGLRRYSTTSGADGLLTEGLKGSSHKVVEAVHHVEKAVGDAVHHVGEAVQHVGAMFRR